MAALVAEVAFSTPGSRARFPAAKFPATQGFPATLHFAPIPAALSGNPALLRYPSPAVR